MIKLKTKMVSFRVSPDEYHKLREACTAQGVDTVSELARAAMYSVIGRQGLSGSIEHQLHDLRERVQVLEEDINCLARHVEAVSVSGPRVAGASASD